jgi:hypothetical protein
VFFLLGGLGGMMSMLMQGKDIMSSPHFVTGSLGLVALALQGMLPLFFADDPNARGLVSGAGRRRGRACACATASACLHALPRRLLHSTMHAIGPCPLTPPLLLPPNPP